MPNASDITVKELAAHGAEKLLQALLHRLGTQPSIQLSQIPTTDLEAELELRAQALYVAPMDNRWRSLLNATARYFSISAAAMLADQRTKAETEARHIFWYVACKTLHHCYSSLGRKVNRDHTSIRHAVLRIQSAIDEGSYRGQRFSIAVDTLSKFVEDLVSPGSSRAAPEMSCLARVSA